MLSFQRLHVYRRSLEFAGLIVPITHGLPRGYSALADQLRRAAFSVILNIAEGAGRRSDGDKARHYSIARGSAMECAAVLDLIKLIKTRPDERVDRGAQLLVQIVAMLTALANKPSAGTGPNPQTKLDREL